MEEEEEEKGIKMEAKSIEEFIYSWQVNNVDVIMLCDKSESRKSRLNFYKWKILAAKRARRTTTDDDGQKKKVIEEINASPDFSFWL